MFAWAIQPVFGVSEINICQNKNTGEHGVLEEVWRMPLFSLELKLKANIT